jgi:hypothetical protein
MAYKQPARWLTWLEHVSLQWCMMMLFDNNVQQVHFLSFKRNKNETNKKCRSQGDRYGEGNGSPLLGRSHDQEVCNQNHIMLRSIALLYMGWIHPLHTYRALPNHTPIQFSPDCVIDGSGFGLGVKNMMQDNSRVTNATVEANELFDIVFVTPRRALSSTTPQWERLPAWAQGGLTLGSCVSRSPWDTSSDRIPPLAQATLILPGLLHTDHYIESHFIQYVPYVVSASSNRTPFLDVLRTLPH